jgi:ketosteroid isomerase-like protein
MVALVLLTTIVKAQSPSTVEQLLDRAQIEDLLTNYYGAFTVGGAQLDMGQFYTEDGVLDVNGLVYNGRKEIQKEYSGTPPAAFAKATFRMLISNPRIVITGDHAIADSIWTGVLSVSVSAPPRLMEQGREHDDLVKQAGHWLLHKRVITSDAGMPAKYRKTYKTR